MIMVNNLKKNIKNYILITLFIFMLLTIFILLKVNNEYKNIPEVKLKETEVIENKNNSLAMMVENENGYEEYTSNIWPNSDEYTYKGATCLDNKGNLISDIITFNPENNTIELNTSQTVRCTLFFDKRSNTLNYDLIYPVGSIYISTTETNPATIFGGSWSKIEGQFLLGSSSAYDLGSTGGEASHVLSVDEMPAHTHFSTNYSTNFNQGVTIPPSRSYAKSYSTGAGLWAYSGASIPGAEISYGSPTSSTGDTQAHNNMPPYLAVNIWKRTA